MLNSIIMAASDPIRWNSLGLSPIALDMGLIKIRWYSLAYIGGIMIGWWYLLKLLAQAGAPILFADRSRQAVTVVLDEKNYRQIPHRGDIERFVEVGMTSGRLRYEEDIRTIPARFTQEQAVHIGVGVRRSVSCERHYQ